MNNTAPPVAIFKASTRIIFSKKSAFDITSKFLFDRTSKFVICGHGQNGENAQNDCLVSDGNVYWARDMECISVTRPKLDVIVADTFISRLVKCRKDGARTLIDVKERSFAVPPNFNAEHYAVHDAILTLVSYDHKIMIMDCSNLVNRAAH